ncbi:hypothetical protein [Microbulbifer sp. SAOS-129_SWC]|uniref:hypothetical protein n=1 Tax=Microbulbifer sp. SAOS-129_SWC TaxID=3145235 RepID=UPI003216213D
MIGKTYLPLTKPESFEFTAKKESEYSIWIWFDEQKAAGSNDIEKCKDSKDPWCLNILRFGLISWEIENTREAIIKAGTIRDSFITHPYGWGLAQAHLQVGEKIIFNISSKGGAEAPIRQEIEIQVWR